MRKAKSYIKKGDIFQVVLSQRFKAKIDKPPLEIYNSLRKLNPSPFMFYFNYDDFQVLGSSPEILVRLINDEVTISLLLEQDQEEKIIKRIKNL